LESRQELARKGSLNGNVRIKVSANCTAPLLARSNAANVTFPFSTFVLSQKSYIFPDGPTARYENNQDPRIRGFGFAKDGKYEVGRFLGIDISIYFPVLAILAAKSRNLPISQRKSEALSRQVSCNQGPLIGPPTPEFGSSCQTQRLVRQCPKPDLLIRATMVKPFKARNNT
jgi:hypothetical protein